MHIYSKLYFKANIRIISTPEKRFAFLYNKILIHFSGIFMSSKMSLLFNKLFGYFYLHCPEVNSNIEYMLIL